MTAQEATIPADDAPAAEATLPVASPDTDTDIDDIDTDTAFPSPDAPPPPPAEGKRRWLVKAQRVIPARESYLMLGDVSFESDGIILRADQVTYSPHTEIAHAEGGVSINAPDGAVYRGEALELNVKTRGWTFTKYAVEYLPGTLGTNFIDTIFLSGEELNFKGGLLEGKVLRATTCDYPTPHYCLQADRMEIYPGDKLIAHDVRIEIFGHRIMRLPWFIIWLRRDRSPVTPTFGHNDYEGYYTRMLYPYALNDQNIGSIRLDQTEKLGTGIGIDHYYSVPRGYGELFLYGRQNFDEYNMRLDHDQFLPGNMKLTLTGDMRQNSQFTSQAATLTNLRAQLRQDSRYAHTTLTYARALNDSPFSTDRTNANLTYQFNRGKDQLRYNGVYSSYGRQDSTGAALRADEELWNHLQWSRQMNFGRLNLFVDQRNDLDGEGDRRYGGTERLPEVYLVTDNKQLQWKFLQRVPSTLTFGWGIFDEPSSDNCLNRYQFNWQLNRKATRLGRAEITPSGSLRQTIYGDPDVTAMYVMNGAVDVRIPFGSFANTLQYRKNDSHGYTPFLFDAAYPAETVRNEIQCITKKLNMHIGSGRDMEHRRWNDLTFRSEYKFTPAMRTSQSCAYDPNRGRWRDLLSQFQLDNPNMALNIDTRYDLEASKLRRVAANFSWVITPLWKLQWLGSYDGTRNELLYNEFLITRDLHCWDVAAHYSYQNKSFYLYLRLKALDIPLPQFGIGRGGQLLSGGQGFP